MFCKNLSDKVSKIKNWRWPSSLFFRALHHGELCFFCGCIFRGENYETKLPVLTFLKKAEKKAFLFHDFLHEKYIDRKNKVHHDEEHGKTKKMAVFIFSVDPQKVV